ncbi:hypothetical protein P153DRAFT_391566 [Dothidotthia symphoricarpi CBS 119687]|uniref:Uncharacterized protein n=1 Tax=Dothidotthia symphoricarpi CBS 119687 TaxID=1392245 RepID=A0A6A5ZX30_9PLEO|nr:uncharacterized protein P153DRAFT_391566 [Dothidotthia symphoricarpi CBS 119687]KAF2123474.1 hypothetical protein P153DRAFT_391566 [Dothidotthia symphoricarpi CBS 119687]
MASLRNTRTGAVALKVDVKATLQLVPSATVANLTWTGLRRAKGEFLWFGADY